MDLVTARKAHAKELSKVTPFPADTTYKVLELAECFIGIAQAFNVEPIAFMSKSLRSSVVEKRQKYLVNALKEIGTRDMPIAEARSIVTFVLARYARDLIGDQENTIKNFECQYQQEPWTKEQPDA